MNNKVLISIFTLLSFVSFGQNCPTRIGDFIINETTTDIDYCRSTNNKIDNGQDMVNHETEYSMIDFDYGTTSTVYELIPDKDKISGWYNRDYASIDDSVKVYFIPYYETEGISIKNLLLKFKDQNLFYIQASISKDYFDILTQKYKGKGIKSAEKKTNNKCNNIKLKKYLDTHVELSFFSEIEDLTAKISMDNIINSDCEFKNTRVIEIYNSKVYLEYLKSRNAILKRLVIEKIEKDKKEKEERLKKF